MSISLRVMMRALVPLFAPGSAGEANEPISIDVAAGAEHDPSPARQPRGRLHARLLGRAIQDQRSRRIQEVHRSRARHHCQVRRQGAGARRPLPGHGRAGQVSPVRRHRVSDLRARRRLFHLARIRSSCGLPPQRGRGGGNHHGGRRGAAALTCLARIALLARAASVADNILAKVTHGRNVMPQSMKLRSFAGASLVALAAALLAVPASAQNREPIKIGFSMALTGGLAPNGKSALLAQKIWEEDINAKGGLLGRPVKLIYYDDKSSAAEVPAIYTKLLDIDKVDLIVGPYATALIAPAMPIVIQRKKNFVGLLGLAVNSEFNYPNYFCMIPSGPDPKPAFTKGFFDVAMAQDPKPQTVAIISADQEFSRNAADGARENIKKAGLKIVYDKNYPPSTTDYAPIVRAIQATNPDLVNINSYPPDSVGMVRAINEIGFKPKMIGGGMVGLQATAIKTQLGPLLNGFVTYDFWLPVPKMQFPGVPTSSRATKPVPGPRASTRSATIWRRGGTPSCRCWRRRSQGPRASTTPNSATTSVPIRSRPWSAT